VLSTLLYVVVTPGKSFNTKPPLEAVAPLGEPLNTKHQIYGQNLENWGLIKNQRPASGRRPIGVSSPQKSPNSIKGQKSSNFLFFFVDTHNTAVK